jgi:hypothetical protein
LPRTRPSSISSWPNCASARRRRPSNRRDKDGTSPALRAGEVETRSVEGEGDRVASLYLVRASRSPSPSVLRTIDLSRSRGRGCFVCPPVPRGRRRLICLKYRRPVASEHRVLIRRISSRQACRCTRKPVASCYGCRGRTVTCGDGNPARVRAGFRPRARGPMQRRPKR